jgi:hypothetical protein
VSWPPAYGSPGSSRDGSSAGGQDASGYPPACLPSRSQLEYTRELIVVALLVLALPWLVTNLITDPGRVLTGLGRRAVQKAPL